MLAGNFGLIHIYCGDGKGKTTAAMGLALRAAGRGLSVVVTQFLKDGDSGELTALKTLPNVTVLSGKEVKGFTFTMTDEQRNIVRVGNNKHLEQSITLCKQGSCQLLILDEVLDALGEKLIDRELFMEFLKSGHGETEVVLTGRNPDNELLELADYVSNIQKIKHPFDQGMTARKGIEF